MVSVQLWSLTLSVNSRSGYEREASLIALQDYGARALPYTLPLVNDWVDVIRDQALSICIRLYGEATAAQIWDSVPHLAQVQRGQRRTDASWRRLYRAVHTRMRRVTTAPESSSTADLVSRYPTVDVAERQLWNGLLAASGLLTEDVGLELLAREPDESTKAALVRTMLRQQPDDATLTVLLGHKNAVVRREALRVAVRRDGLTWPGFDELLGDPSRAVRDVAATAARRHGVVPAEVCRQRVATQPTPGFVAGLGETGYDQDAALVEPLLHVDDPALLRAAVGAFAELRQQESAEVVYQMLSHPHGGKTALRMLRRLRLPVSGERCYRDYLASDSAVARRRLLRALCTGTSWDSLPWLVRLYRDLPDDLAAETEHAMLGWRPGFCEPTPEQCAALTDALRESRRVPIAVQQLARDALASARW